MRNWILCNFSLLPFSHINEDKRKTEGQKQIFDVVYEVDGCPVSLMIANVSLYIYIVKISSFFSVDSFSTLCDTFQPCGLESTHYSLAFV